MTYKGHYFLTPLTLRHICLTVSHVKTTHSIYGLWLQLSEDLRCKQLQDAICFTFDTKMNEYWIVSVRKVYSSGFSTQFMIESNPKLYCNIQWKFVLATLNSLYSKKIHVGRRQTKNVIIITMTTLNIRNWRISRLVLGFFSVLLFVWLDVDVDISTEPLRGGRNVLSEKELTD